MYNMGLRCRAKQNNARGRRTRDGSARAVAPEAGAVAVTVMVDVLAGGEPPGMATARMESESTK